MTRSIVNDRVDAIYCPKCQGRDDMALRRNPTASAGPSAVMASRASTFSAVPRPQPGRGLGPYDDCCKQLSIRIIRSLNAESLPDDQNSTSLRLRRFGGVDYHGFAGTGFDREGRSLYRKECPGDFVGSLIGAWLTKPGGLR
jgi:hypothetical protein